ncbi:MAG TPA: two-component regulator propeller domain-containing protein, partial [Bacteroidia bacterium]|nr:two-component regulator propeller domain-containing protein [Bacteroidia bacterium]
RLGIPQGLSSDPVQAILTDSWGFTWIGTINGLNRFDGETFKLYEHHSGDSASIPGDNVCSLAQDKNGELWVGTDNGIALFNPWNEEAVTIKCEQPAGKKVAPPNHLNADALSGVVRAWSKDAAWIYNKDRKCFEPEIICSKQANGPDGCSGLYSDSENRLWICSYDGLYVYSTHEKKITRHYQPLDASGKPVFFTGMIEVAPNDFWVTTWGSGFGRFTANDEQFHLYSWIDRPENPSASNIAFTLAAGKEHGRVIVWVGTNSGLFRIAANEFPSKDNVTRLHNEPLNAESLPDDGVGCVEFNRYGQLWAGTGKGAGVILPQQQLFQPFAEQFRGQTIRIVHDKGPGIFFCTWYGNGLQLCDSSGNILHAWKHVPENNPDIDCGQVSDVLRASDSTLWVATFGGLCHGDKNGKKFTQLLPSPNEKNSVCDRHIISLAEAPGGIFWFGSYGKGVSRYDEKKNTWTNFRADSSGNSLCDNLVWDILCDREGRVWFATNTGISTYDEASGKFRTWKNIIRGNDTIPFGIATSAFEDSRGVLWFTDDHGLFFIDRDGRAGMYGKDDGLSPGAVTSINEDTRGILWICTTNGLSCFDPAKKIFTRYSITSGLPTNIMDGDISPLGGNMIIGLMNSVIIFNPVLLTQDVPANAPQLVSISLLGKKIGFSTSPAYAPELFYNWDQNTFTFDFISLGFRGGPGVSYSYMLEGAENDWNYSGARHVASYGGLPPGSYHFLFRVSSGNGQWSSPGSFSFTIRPPFWKTWWFITLSVVTLLALIVFIVRREATRKMRVRILQLEKLRAIEKERNRISRDMHDDLGSGLTKIAILSEVAKKQVVNDSAKKQIDTISESARNLVDNLNEIVWALNPENDNLQNLVAYIREYADHYLETFGIAFHCETPAEIPAVHLSEEKRRFLFLVVKESLHNIVKHANATKVETLFSFADGKISIVIGDNGKGFEISEARPMGNGLKNMRKRMESIGGMYTIASEPGKGTRTEINLSW